MGLPHSPTTGNSSRLMSCWRAVKSSRPSFLMACIVNCGRRYRRMTDSKSRLPDGVGTRNRGQLRMTSFMAIWKLMNGSVFDAYLKQIWRRGDGRGLNIHGDMYGPGGHHTQKVYEFCKERLGAASGQSRANPRRVGKRNPVWPTKRPTSKSKSQLPADYDWRELCERCCPRSSAS